MCTPIDFAGGVVMEVRTEEAADINKMRTLLETAMARDAEHEKGAS